MALSVKSETHLNKGVRIMLKNPEPACTATASTGSSTWILIMVAEVTR